MVFCCREGEKERKGTRKEGTSEGLWEERETVVEGL